MVVFGGSYGIGADIAELAERYGAQVFSFSRSLNGMHVEDAEAVSDALDGTAEETGRIDYVVNTAGVLHMGKLAEIDDDDDRRDRGRELPRPRQHRPGRHPAPPRDAGPPAALHLQLLHPGPGRLQPLLLDQGRRGQPHPGARRRVGRGRRPGQLRQPGAHRTPMRTRAFGEEPAHTLLSPRAVAQTSLDVLISDLTGQVIDVRLQTRPDIPGRIRASTSAWHPGRSTLDATRHYRSTLDATRHVDSPTAIRRIPTLQPIQRPPRRNPTLHTDQHLPRFNPTQRAYQGKHRHTGYRRKMTRDLRTPSWSAPPCSAPTRCSSLPPCGPSPGCSCVFCVMSYAAEIAARRGARQLVDLLSQAHLGVTLRFVIREMTAILLVARTEGTDSPWFMALTVGLFLMHGVRALQTWLAISYNRTAQPAAGADPRHRRGEDTGSAPDILAQLPGLCGSSTSTCSPVGGAALGATLGTGYQGAAGAAIALGLELMGALALLPHLRRVRPLQGRAQRAAGGRRTAARSTSPRWCSTSPAPNDSAYQANMWLATAGAARPARRWSCCGSGRCSGCWRRHLAAGGLRARPRAI